MFFSQNDIGLPRQGNEHLQFELKLEYPLHLLHHFNGIINSVFLSSEDDSISWMFVENKEFSVKSCYNILNDGGLISAFRTNIWKSIAPLKVKIFSWLVFHGKILSQVNLIKRGWTGPLYCDICGFYEESFSHIFLHCPI